MIQFLILLSFLIIKPISSILTLNGIVLSENDYNRTWMYFPDGDNNLRIAILVKTNISDKAIYPMRAIEDNVKLELFTRQNLDEPEILSFPDQRYKRSIKISNLFNSKTRIKFIIHGWSSNTGNPVVQKIKNEYLKRNEYNIIAVNWSKIAGNINYYEVVNNVPKVAKVIAPFIDYLVINLKIDPKSIHIIGHSLGAHLSGYIGKLIEFKIGRITGLDPAKPLYQFDSSDNRLSSNDADFVDIIHTCAGFFGLEYPIGNIDFYPNDGYPPQPGCSKLFEILTCSHGRSFEYYAESINSEIGFWSYPCDNYLNFEANLCRNNPILMGNDVPLNASGIYYFKTNSKSKYAQGRTFESNMLFKRKY